MDFRLDNFGRLYFIVDHSTTNLLRVANESLLASTWQHVTVVWDGTTAASNARLYINGQEVTYLTTTNGVGARSNDSTRDIRIGRSEGGSNTFDGTIDDVRIFNRVLNEQEIQALYRLGEGSKINVTPTDPDNLKDGLVGQWTFDGSDMSTSTALDVSGNGNHATLVNAPTRSIGKIGQSLYMTSSNMGAEVSNHSSIQNLPQLTVATWYKVPQLSGNAFVVHKSIGFGTGWIMTANTNDGEVYWYRRFSGSSAQWRVVGLTFRPNEWVHLAVTYDNTSTANNPTIYVNGVAMSASTIVAPSGTAQNDSTSPFYLANSLDYEFGFGSLDDVRIYNRILSPAEVKQLYELGGGSTIRICEEEAVQDADGNWYNTIAIGSQCWLDRNMNVGTRISASTAQTDNGVIEKYCYSNSDANCDDNHPNRPDGGLYQWNEAMQYSTAEGARGICPVGFHIPTDAEWHTLEKFLADRGQSCGANRTGDGCSPAGKKLQPDGSSRFEGNHAGVIFSGSSIFTDSHGYFWSSLASGSDAIVRYLVTSESRINRSLIGQSNGASVRCIQD